MRIATNARRLSSVLLVALAVTSATGAITASIAVAATNAISNGTFEGSGAGSTSGWGGSSGTLSVVAGNGGGHAAQLTANAGATQTYAYTTSKPVTNAVAGTTYHLDGQVQSATPGQSVCLVLKELKAGTQTSVGSAQNCTTATSAWQNFPTVTYSVKTGGDSLTVNILEKPAITGATYSFDNLVLAAGTAPPPDQTPPDVPTGVTAVANSATSVTVSWAASFDAVGTVGYHVYRNGSNTSIQTVTGGATSWTDTSVLPNSTYTYTVDAFDAVPNTSSQSQASAPVTTPSPAPDTTPPDVPTGVKAVANSPTSVTVSWAASFDAVGTVGYDVYRDGSTTAIQTVTGGATSWTDTTVQPNTSYSYTVDAFDAVPNTSDPSAAAQVTTPQSGGSGGGPSHPIIVIMMENKHYADIVGNSAAPYIQTLLAKGTNFTNYQAQPGSLPDYLLNTSGLNGSTSGSDNIFHQLQVKGVSWGEYLESMPSTCYTGGDTGSYKKAHNPAVYYNDITSSPTACANVLPFTSFSTSNLRAFSYVVPNLADDMHDGATRTAQIQAGDAWLAAHMPAMLSAGAEVILTWDEGSKADEHVATIGVGGSFAAGATDSHLYTHPGLLAGLEDAWSLPRLNGAQTAAPFPI